MAGRGARTAASFCVFLTLEASDFLCVAIGAFLGVALRSPAFFGADLPAATFFLTATFFVCLPFVVTFDFVDFRDAVFFAMARVAFGRDFEAVTRLLAVALGAERRATAREPERLKLLVAALIGKFCDRAKVAKRFRKLRWQSNIASVLNQSKPPQLVQNPPFPLG